MMKKAMCIASAVLTAASCNVFSAAATNEDANIFVLDYSYSDNKVSAVLSLEGYVCIGGFEAHLSYDRQKYEVLSISTENGDVLANNSKNKGKINVAMAGVSNLRDEGVLVTMELSCNEKPEKSDFEFDVASVYMIDENYDSQSVDFTIDENWKEAEGGEVSPSYTLGDVNNDGFVDSSDASLILGEYAMIQTGEKATFTETQVLAADVNKDKATDSSDASKILGYYAASSTGSKPSWD